jgi:glycosyltransferase involved in cell wall biosynthesis
MSNPKLTVLMPVYNAASYLHEAIDSILQQTFRDFEFLIIDDGSTDQSIAIVQSYKDPRIRFVRNETNAGIAATLNRGIELASCELIARMDADDISYPDRLQKQYDYMMHDSACALLSTWCRVVTAAGKHVRLERYTSRFFYYNLTFECWIYHPTVMFRKAAVKEVVCIVCLTRKITICSGSWRKNSGLRTWAKSCWTIASRQPVSIPCFAKRNMMLPTAKMYCAIYDTIWGTILRFRKNTSNAFATILRP